MSYKAAHQLIKDHYGSETQKRSKLPLINHINEGITILEKLYASEDTIAAWCIHPLVQNDLLLTNFIKVDYAWLSTSSVALAMEYRRVANLYLPKQYRNSSDRIELSQLPQVNLMLVADKVQNTKDFTANQSLYPNSTQLEGYFNNWLTRLGVTKNQYDHLRC